MTMDREHRQGRALVITSAAMCAAVLVLRARRLSPFTLDDTFITLRYSKHLAAGLGPAWNPGEAPVEGYTSALWMLVCAVAEWVGLNGVSFAKWSGVAFSLMALGVAAKLAHELTPARHGPRIRALSSASVFGLAAAYWPLALHSISGMETGLSALLLTLFWYCCTRYMARPSRRLGTWLAVLALSATLARPEAALACGASLVLTCAQARGSRLPLARGVLLWCVLPGVLYFCLRYARYGLLFPLPFYVKAVGKEQLAGLTDVANFYAPLVFAPPSLGWLAIAGIWFARREASAASLGLLTFTAFFLFPEHVMGVEGRYLFPLFPMLVALAGAGAGALLGSVLERMSAGARVRSLTAAGMGLALLTYGCWGSFPLGETERSEHWVDYGKGLNRAHLSLARAMARARAVVPKASIALLDVGAVGYIADWKTLDTFGLNDARVALSQRRDVNYVFSGAPDLVVLISQHPTRFVPVFDWEVPLHEQALARGYVTECSYAFEDDYHLLVLVRPEFPLAETPICAPPATLALRTAHKD